MITLLVCFDILEDFLGWYIIVAFVFRICGWIVWVGFWRYEMCLGVCLLFTVGFC